MIAEDKRLQTEKAILQAKKASLAVTYKEAFADRSRMSLGEIASLRPGNPLFSAAAIPAIQRANAIQRAELWATGARLAGNVAGAEKATQFANDLRTGFDALVSSEQDPLGSMVSQQTETNQKLAALLEREAAMGLKIQPKNGE